MPSIFSRIIAGEIPCHKIAENKDFFAFLDINPNAKGHTLVVPKKEVDYVFDMEDSHYLDFMKFAKTLAPSIQKAVPCNRIGVFIIGLEVPHAHIHLIPLSTMEDIDFQKKLKPSQEELAETAEAIKKFVNI
eukprot:TRINITY_DN2480_c0_g1_i4.p1 TRINITY_DN2480_c0_g1~~TRINITY_DN2480_c0_g1_i4.p1  ORF type:complete len:132 (-),score=35.64 TRINITY_DN2480_c0_g1_i4:99-494(-)